MGHVHVGLSGWQYDSWRGDWYPKGLPARRQLEYVAEHFDTVELNGSFYSLQLPTSYRRWRDTTPPGFLFAVKGGRYITHMKRLVDVETALANFFASGVLALDDKLGPLLWQLPERVRFDADVVRDFLDLLPRTTTDAAELAAGHDEKLRGRVHLEAATERRLRHALEVRHASFVDNAFFRLLEERDMACVVADSPRRWPELDVRTTDFTYARLHGHTELYASGYSARSLDRWAERCTGWARHGDIYLYFDNDARGRAPFDAEGLVARLSRSAV